MAATPQADGLSPACLGGSAKTLPQGGLHPSLRPDPQHGRPRAPPLPCSLSVSPLHRGPSPADPTAPPVLSSPPLWPWGSPAPGTGSPSTPAPLPTLALRGAGVSSWPAGGRVPQRSSGPCNSRRRLPASPGLSFHHLPCPTPRWLAAAPHTGGLVLSSRLGQQRSRTRRTGTRGYLCWACPIVLPRPAGTSGRNPCSRLPEGPPGLCFWEDGAEPEPAARAWLGPAVWSSLGLSRHPWSRKEETRLCLPRRDVSGNASA